MAGLGCYLRVMMERAAGHTDRWLGVFRSVGREPMSEAHYAQVEVHRKRFNSIPPDSQAPLTDACSESART